MSLHLSTNPSSSYVTLSPPHCCSNPSACVELWGGHESWIFFFSKLANHTVPQSVWLSVCLSFSPSVIISDIFNQLINIFFVCFSDYKTFPLATRAFLLCNKVTWQLTIQNSTVQWAQYKTSPDHQLTRYNVDIDHVQRDGVTLDFLTSWPCSWCCWRSATLLFGIAIDCKHFNNFVFFVSDLLFSDLSWIYHPGLIVCSRPWSVAPVLSLLYGIDENNLTRFIWFPGGETILLSLVTKHGNIHRRSVFSVDVYSLNLHVHFLYSTRKRWTNSQTEKCHLKSRHSCYFILLFLLRQLWVKLTRL